MKRNSVLKVVNPILAVLLLNQVLTGLLREVLPGEVFEVMHVGGGVLLALVAVMHVVLNWNWIRNNFRRASRAAEP